MLPSIQPRNSNNSTINRNYDFGECRWFGNFVQGDMSSLQQRPVADVIMGRETGGREINADPIWTRWRLLYCEGRLS